jgi:hypothetical protein
VPTNLHPQGACICVTPLRESCSAIFARALSFKIVPNRPARFS